MSDTLTPMFYLTPLEMEQDTVTMGDKLYFVWHGMEGRPAKRIVPTGFQFVHPSGQVDREYAQFVIGAQEHSSVLRTFDFERDLEGFDGCQLPDDLTSEQMASAMMAYVEMVRSHHRVRMVRLDNGMYGVQTYVPPVAVPDDDEDDRL